MVTVSINDQKFDVPSVDIVYHQELVDDLVGISPDVRTVAKSLEVAIDPNALIWLPFKRKLTIHMPNAIDSLKEADAIYPGLEVQFDNSIWVLYRRDFKRNKIHFREL